MRKGGRDRKVTVRAMERTMDGRASFRFFN
jgi:hypothetical protein